jgi:hypothetical protein
MDRLPEMRHAWPWCALFGTFGLAVGITECAWLALPPSAWTLILIVFFTMGWGFGFDIAKRRMMPHSQRHAWLFWTISAILLVTVAGCAGGLGVLLNGFHAAPRVP